MTIRYEKNDFLNQWMKEYNAETDSKELINDLNDLNDKKQLLRKYLFNRLQKLYKDEIIKYNDDNDNDIRLKALNGKCKSKSRVNNLKILDALFYTKFCNMMKTKAYRKNSPIFKEYVTSGIKNIYDDLRSLECNIFINLFVFETIE